MWGNSISEREVQRNKEEISVMCWTEMLMLQGGSLTDRDCFLMCGCPEDDEWEGSWSLEMSRSKSVTEPPPRSVPRHKKVLFSQHKNTKLHKTRFHQYFTFETGSHIEADWLRVQVRSGAARAGSLLSSVFPMSDRSEESGDCGSVLSSSLSTSKATRLGLKT